MSADDSPMSQRLPFLLERAAELGVPVEVRPDIERVGPERFVGVARFTVHANVGAMPPTVHLASEIRQRLEGSWLEVVGMQDLELAAQLRRRRVLDDDTTRSPRRYYPGNQSLPAGIALLRITDELWNHDVFTVERTTINGVDGDMLNVDWDAYERPGLPVAMQRIAGLARSLLDGSPVDLSLMIHLSPKTGQRVLDALALIWDDAR